ncbi:Bacteriophage head-to-tail connecting protein [Desulfovibrio sp. X2]|uniref:portal protein n=1 Tax=Desulfovibrio sp. X2 TaxID=941449 RepID=UPI000358B5FA|nr:portal protein [Desulfovibrio sp. X2]EPR44573.1 Bacteriophage head-to-tail connecting protein [Desulfovibrio sp. X2]
MTTQTSPSDPARRLADARALVRTLEDRRAPWDDHLREVADYVLPDKGRFPGREGGRESDPGGKRMGRIIDSTATRACQIMAAGLMGGLTSPAKPWFRLGTRDKELREWGPVRDWLDAAERALYAVLARSNFYQCVHGLYLELGGFGSACLFCEADDERAVRFRTLTFGEYAWSCDHLGRVGTVAVRRELTAGQLAERFGAQRLSRAVLAMLGTRREQDPVEIVHLVRPREGAAAGRDGLVPALEKPFESLVFEARAAGADEDAVLHEGGFDAFPFLCPRWDVTGAEEYGRGPGMTVLPDVKMLQEMAKGRLQAVHLGLRPPMRVPSKFAKRLNLVPGGQNYVNPQQAEGLAPLYESRVSIAEVTAVIEDVRRQVKEGFYNDLFLMISGMERSGVTATEIMEKQAEKLLMLGPIVERLQSELLDPLVERCFSLAERAGLVPPPPPEMTGYLLSGGRMRVEYVSMLSQAQKLSGSQSIMQLLSVAGQMAAAEHEVLDKIDFEQALDELSLITGVPAGIVRPDEEVARLRARRRAEALDQGLARNLGRVLGAAAPAGLPAAQAKEGS